MKTVVLLVLSLSVGAIVIACVLITQPILSLAHPPRETIVVDIDRLQNHVRHLSEVISPRGHRSPANLDRASEYIAEQFRLAGAEVEFQPYEVAGQIYRNVIARYGPKTKQRLIVGAHYDSCEFEIGKSFPGADDNASGVAGLLELAHLIRRDLPQIGVELVAYTLEEPPYFRTASMGSTVHARHLSENHVQVRAMIALEMIGYFSSQANSQTLPCAGLSVLYPSRGNFIAVVGGIGDIFLTRKIKDRMRRSEPLMPVRSISAPRFIPGIDFSDHLSYWTFGFPAVMITDTAFYRNSRYHTVNDTYQTLDYERMAQVVRGVFGAVRELSGTL